MTGTRRYERMFARLARRGEAAFVPFVVLGDPDPGRSLEIVRSLARAGADALELGFPFSDPVADGPTIQAAGRRALDAGTTLEDVWAIIAAVRGEWGDLPIGLLVYANLVLHASAGRFYARAAAVGADSVLIADVPSIESAPLERVATARGIAPVLIAPPNAPPERLCEIAARSRGYVYVTSRPGVTGVEAGPGLRSDAAAVLARLRAIEPSPAPPLLGFGIGRPEHARHGLALGAAGVICGSAIVERIGRDCAGGDGLARLLVEMERFVTDMKRATRGPQRPYPPSSA